MRQPAVLAVPPPGAKPFHFQPLTEVYIPPTPYWLYYGSAREEAGTYAAAGECLVLRRGGGPEYIRPQVVAELRARGWEERVDVLPDRGFNVKVVKLCPPAAMGNMRGLGQIHPQVRVIVVDRRGYPGSNIGVNLVVPSDVSPQWGGAGEGITDSDGVVTFKPTAKSPVYDLVVGLPEGEVRQRIQLSPGLNLFSFRSKMKINGPIVTTIEGVAALVGVGMIVGGAVFGGKVVGEILMGIGGSVTAASVYSAVSRHV